MGVGRECRKCRTFGRMKGEGIDEEVDGEGGRWEGGKRRRIGEGFEDVLMRDF